MNVLGFADALSRASDCTKHHVILGNGFSIAIRPDIFTYVALLESANFSGRPNVRRLFDDLKTQDFEVVIKALSDAAAVLKVYEPGNASLIATFENDVGIVEEALVTAVATRHPNRPFDISSDQYRKCRLFLSRFDHIYTLNYDVLLYWTLLQDEVDALKPLPDDGFAILKAIPTSPT